jgi:hypothetical protein
MSARKVRGGCERKVGQSSNNGECGVTASKIEHALACVVGEGDQSGRRLGCSILPMSRAC